MGGPSGPTLSGPIALATGNKSVGPEGPPTTAQVRPEKQKPSGRRAFQAAKTPDLSARAPSGTRRRRSRGPRSAAAAAARCARSCRRPGAAGSCVRSRPTTSTASARR
ncbi:DUF6053 domain-containing protein [Lysobacter enzymogenes]|uniref:DUF6053 domain-containing protein n=1 Tax=Lysobacter enzymogenes TaxID=69 RepID=UPI003D2F57CC